MAKLALARDFSQTDMSYPTKAVTRIHRSKKTVSLSPWRWTSKR